MKFLYIFVINNKKYYFSVNIGMIVIHSKTQEIKNGIKIHHSNIKHKIVFIFTLICYLLTILIMYYYTKIKNNNMYKKKIYLHLFIL